VPEKNSFETGQFCWADLATTDPDAAKTFYSSLFGWEIEDMPIPGGGTYSMARVNGRYTGALSEQMEEERAQGIPPHWNVYVSVEDVDTYTKKAEAAGGTIITQPFDVLDSGRMAVIADPTQAIFCMWQPQEHPGYGLVNEPGAMDWNELLSGDPERARAFYTELFDWKAETMSMGAGPDAPDYTVFSLGEQPVAGLMQAPEGMPMPPQWTVYYNVADCDASASKVTELGGQVYFGPQFMETVGKFATCADPQGAVFAIIEPDQSAQTQ
jgi:predicted enzyme related to lactoylglutathione lyase